MCVLTDVSDADQVDSMAQQALERFGGIDILVNNAGARPGPDRVPVVELEEAAWDEVQNVNLKGTFLCCRAVSRHMIDRGKAAKSSTCPQPRGDTVAPVLRRTAPQSSACEALRNLSP